MKRDRKQYLRKWRTENRDKVQASHKKWYDLHRKNYYEKNKEYLLRQHSEWLKTDKGKKHLKRMGERAFQKYPEKFEARSILRHAVRSGKIEKLPCEMCGNNKSQGHHEDYLKPLSVRWLCEKHHKEVHKK